MVEGRGGQCCLAAEGQQEGALWRQRCSAAQLCHRQYPGYNGSRILQSGPIRANWVKCA